MPSIPRHTKPQWAKSNRTGFQEENRRTDPRYHTHRWRKLRRSKLNENPLCEECEKGGIVTAATDVDHIIRVKMDESKFWEYENLQSLCGHHHKSKSAKERGR